MELLGEIGQWSWFVVWALLLVAASLCVYLGLGGTFIVLGLALVHAVIGGFEPITWQLLLVLVGLSLGGELLEFLIGTFYVAQKGATRRGVWGAFVGGLAGSDRSPAALAGRCSANTTRTGNWNPACASGRMRSSAASWPW
jgi:uncharacterized protein YqgC (DUF456 family)